MSPERVPPPENTPESLALNEKLNEVIKLVKSNATPSYRTLPTIRRQLLPRALIGEALNAGRSFVTVANITASYGDPFKPGNLSVSLSLARTEAVRRRQNDLSPYAILSRYLTDRIGHAATQKLFEVAKAMVENAPPDPEGTRKMNKQSLAGTRRVDERQEKKRAKFRPEVGSTNTVQEVEEAIMKNAAYAAFVLDGINRAEESGGGWPEMAANLLIPQETLGELIRKHRSQLNDLKMWIHQSAGKR